MTGEGRCIMFNIMSNRDIIKKSAVWLAFLLPVVIMLSIFIVKGIYPFGDRSFLFSDMYHQYLPFFVEFIRKIRAGESLFYSYNVGMGSNFPALYGYYLASPFNWLGLLVPEKYLIEFMSYLVILRIGLCGLTSYIYLQKHFNIESPSALFFSSFYALSGFMAAYNYNVMWLDCVILLPLIMLGLEHLVKEGKCGLYCITLFLSILSNYYISIMICIFLVLYFLALCVTEKISVKTVLRFALYSVLAAGMAGAVLIPEVCAILATDFGDIEFPDKIKIYFSILDELKRHCISVSTERGLEHWPNIYCGAAVFMLIPMYVINSGISIRKRFVNLALAGIFLLSFSINIPDFIWHGFNYPDSLPARQSFIYIFLVIVISFEAYLKMDEVSEKHILYGYLSAAVFLIYSDATETGDDFEPGIILISLLFVTIYAVLLYIKRTHGKASVNLILAMITLIVTVTELSTNTINTSVGTVSRSAYIDDLEDYEKLNEYAKEHSDSPIYRIEKFSKKTKNDGTLAGYPSASVFSSTMNSTVMDMYKRLGMRYSKVFYAYDGATPLVAGLLNVDWMFGEISDSTYEGDSLYEKSLYYEEEQSGDIVLYHADYTLPFGYVAPIGYDMPEELTGVRLQNQMTEDLGIEGTLLENVDKDKKQTDDSLCITADKDGNYFAMITSSGTKKVKLVYNDREDIKLSDLKNDSIINLGYLSKGDKVYIENADEEDETPKVFADIYVLNENVLEKAFEMLGNTHMENVTSDTTHIKGTLNLENEGRLILSVPYEKGWTITVNGTETEPELFADCLIALDLQPGQYEISMNYVPYGTYAGIIVSIVSAIIFTLTQILRSKIMK
jgi:uncharacterized membrane protein YfhO